jgi:AcrR family transcriptional regulator
VTQVASSPLVRHNGVVTTQDQQVGRRDRKRRNTRTALAEAGLELFEELGFAATNIEDITERADVSRRTFFRYFPTKEALLLADPAEYEHVLVRALDAQELPLTMSRVFAAIAAAAEATQDTEATRRRQAAIIAANQLEVSNIAWQSYSTARDTLTNHIAVRTGLDHDDRRITVTANLALFTMSLAFIAWTEGQEHTTLTAEFESTVDVLRALVNDDLTLGDPS